MGSCERILRRGPEEEKYWSDESKSLIKTQVLVTHQRFPTWMFSCAMVALTSFPTAIFPSMVNEVVLDPSVSSRLITVFGFPGWPFSSISMYPSFLVCFTNEFKS